MEGAPSQRAGGGGAGVGGSFRSAVRRVWGRAAEDGGGELWVRVVQEEFLWCPRPCEQGGQSWCEVRVGHACVHRAV